MLEITYNNPFASSFLHIMRVTVKRLSLYALHLSLALSIYGRYSVRFSLRRMRRAFAIMSFAFSAFGRRSAIHSGRHRYFHQANVFVPSGFRICYTWCFEGYAFPHIYISRILAVAKAFLSLFAWPCNLCPRSSCIHWIVCTVAVLHIEMSSVRDRHIHHSGMS